MLWSSATFTIGECMFYRLFKYLAFKVDPELAHDQTLRLVSKFPRAATFLCMPRRQDERFRLKVGTLQWQFPVGLAAGLDKDACAIDFFTRLNFGAVEVGSITPLPQNGNPPPRLFRLPQDKSLLNRMGFNNIGGLAALANIKKSNRNGKILGVSLGKNSKTPEDKIVEDYRNLHKTFSDVADYLVINVSSPNTSGLGRHQKGVLLRELLAGMSDVRTTVPLYLKVSPTLDQQDIWQIADLAKQFRLGGIVATNTMPSNLMGGGGISGELLKERSQFVRNEFLRCFRESPDMPVIGVGGISSIDDLVEFWRNGGRVVQIYTSFIYQGHKILEILASEITSILERTGAKNLTDLLDNIDQIDTPQTKAINP